ncbi:MAG: dockerin type I repeat-containing protein [Clostridia bacterium]|nr:dockerin type I repeat-containing protein [Clostridia bacterium]
MKRAWMILLVLCLLGGSVTVLAENQGIEDDWEDTETYAQGDVNGDGKINVMDYGMVKRFTMRQIQFTDAQFDAADVNGDGKANALDYMILKRVVMKLGEFPCRHVYDETVVGNLHVFTCRFCKHQYERFDGELIG